MAKALKKRALAEYSQTILVEAAAAVVQPHPPKRLRLRKPARTDGDDGIVPAVLEEEISNLDPSRSSADNFKALSRIVSFFPSTNVCLLLIMHDLKEIRN